MKYTGIFQGYNWYAFKNQQHDIGQYQGNQPDIKSLTAGVLL